MYHVNRQCWGVASFDYLAAFMHAWVYMYYCCVCTCYLSVPSRILIFYSSNGTFINGEKLGMCVMVDSRSLSCHA